MIRLYVKILSEFVSLILQDRCWVVHIPFVPMVKFKFLVQFPVDHLAYPDLSCLDYYYYYYHYYLSAASLTILPGLTTTKLATCPVGGSLEYVDCKIIPSKEWYVISSI